MDQEDPIEKRIEHNAKRLGRLYLGICFLLLQLPVPVTLPNHPEVPQQMLLALQKAREVMDEEPMDEDLRYLLKLVMLEWLTAYELAALIRSAGPAPWRVDAMEARIDHAVEFAETAAELLGTMLE